MDKYILEKITFYAHKYDFSFYCDHFGHVCFLKKDGVLLHETKSHDTFIECANEVLRYLDRISPLNAFNSHLQDPRIKNLDIKFEGEEE